MIDNLVPHDALVRGSDLQHIIDQLNMQNVIADGQTILASETTGGRIISVVDQYGGGGGAGVAASDVTPFKVVVNSDDNQALDVLSGSCIVKDYDGFTRQSLAMVQETLDLTSITTTTTIYIYAKVKTEWQAASSLRDYPIASIETNSFYFNESKFPEIDVSSYFYPIAEVDITVTDGVKSFEIKQIALTDITINGVKNFPFKFTMFRDEKLTDLAADTNYKYFLNGGTVTHPEGNVTLSAQTGSVLVESVGHSYIQISFVLNADSFSTTFSATLNAGEGLTSLPNNTATTYNVSTSNWLNGAVYQSLSENFASDGRIW
jgi:hypothetical protein